MNFELWLTVWEQCEFTWRNNLGFALCESCSAAAGPELVNEAARLCFVFEMVYLKVYLDYNSSG